MKKKLLLLLITLLLTNTRVFSSSGAIFFKSLILPYWSMESIQKDFRKKIYLTTDAILFLGHIGSNRYGDWKKDEYRNYAVEHAGVRNADQKNDGFYKDLKFYDSIHYHNLYASQDTYDDLDEYYWKWESEADKKHFRDLRNSSESAYQAGRLFLGGLILNRLICAIDAVRLYNKQKRLNISANSFYNGESATVQLTYYF